MPVYPGAFGPTPRLSLFRLDPKALQHFSCIKIYDTSVVLNFARITLSDSRSTEAAIRLVIENK
jgi:hypothetical protein